jgi:MoxR-like ATPase
VISLLRAAQAWAFLHGHAGVLPEDLQAVLPAVVSHRLRPRDASDSRSPLEVAATLLKSVPIP